MLGLVVADISFVVTRISESHIRRKQAEAPWDNWRTESLFRESCEGDADLHVMGHSPNTT